MRHVIRLQVEEEEKRRKRKQKQRTQSVMTVGLDSLRQKKLILSLKSQNKFHACFRVTST